MQANPTSGSITAGKGTITGQGTNHVTINQTSNKLAINWNSFSIGKGETVQFIQPGASSIALNRVLGNNALAIYGQLSANGKVFLIITVANGGYAALLGTNVANEGVILAKEGTVALGAGSKITLDFIGDGLLTLAVDESKVKAELKNSGLIQADGGLVIMNAKAADTLTGSVVNNTGTIEAKSVIDKNGVIILSGDSVTNAGYLMPAEKLPVKPAARFYSFSLGQLDMDSKDAADNDSAHTAGDYHKTNLNFYRIQKVNNRLNLHFSFAGQLASKNLDSSEKISLGGPSGVRAYPVNEASGDEGYVATGELRWNLPDPRVQITAFIDGGHVTLNKNPWTTDANSRTLSGAGLGFIFSRPGDYALRVDYAWKLSSSDAVSDTDRSGRFWLQGVKYF